MDSCFNYTNLTGYSLSSQIQMHLKLMVLAKSDRYQFPCAIVRLAVSPLAVSAKDHMAQTTDHCFPIMRCISGVDV